MGDLVVRLRAGAVLGFVVGSGPAVLWLVGPSLRGESTVESALSALLGWALLLSWGFLSLTAALMAFEALLTGHTRRSVRWAPRAVRIVVGAACGLGLGTVAAPAALADPGEQPTTVSLVDGLTLPDRAAGSPPQPPDEPPHRRVVTVRAGDSLWAIARAHGIEWPRLYEANRSVLGDDPDLIHPGVRLVVPSSSSEGDGR